MKVWRKDGRMEEATGIIQMRDDRGLDQEDSIGMVRSR